jgi:uncharacterized protein (TIGR02145 family)
MKTIKRVPIFIVTVLALSLFTGCDKKETIIPVPILTTLTVTDITENSAKTGGEITSDEGSSVSARGICWKKDSNPSLSDNKTIDSIGIGKYNSAITGLTAGTTYYVRAYATNSSGTSYGNTITFKTLATATTVEDIDKNVYKTVNIGTQTWMAENLRTTSYRNGEAITNFTDPAKWSSATISVYCNYDNNTLNGSKYGLLYNWAAIKDVRNIAPIGWHIATNDEWKTLINYLGGENGAGAKLKETGTSHWNLPNTGANNESGFTALPSGSRDSFGTFGSIGNNGYWWSSTEQSSTNAYTWYLNNNDNSVQNSYKLKASGYAVRCVKDSN